MTDPNDHFELLFETPYVRAVELRGKDCTVTIERVEGKVKIVGDGGKVAIKPLLHFKGAGKPMVCNITNARTIMSMYGKAASNWVGCSITLYPTVDRGKDCIRIRDKVPQSKQQQRRPDQPPSEPPQQPTPDLAGLVLQRINAAVDIAELETAAPSATEVAKLEDSGDYDRVNERYEDREAEMEQQAETEAIRG